MRAKWVGLVGLIAVTAWSLTACGQTGSSVKEAVSSIAASHTAAVTQSGPTAPPTQEAPTKTAPTPAVSAQAATSAHSAGGGGAAAPSQSLGASAKATGTPAAAAGSGSGWGWFWLAVGIAAVAGIAAMVAAWVVRRRRRRSSAAIDWQTRVIEAYAKGSALYDTMAAVQTPGGLTAADAALRWSDIQRRADDYSELLYRMEQAAPGDQERLVVAGVISSLQAVRSAMDAERSARSADDSLSGTVYDRLAYFASALRSLRQPNVRPA